MHSIIDDDNTIAQKIDESVQNNVDVIWEKLVTMGKVDDVKELKDNFINHYKNVKLRVIERDFNVHLT